jgi:hypothetical protein
MKFIKAYQKFGVVNESNSDWGVYYVYPSLEEGDAYEYVNMKGKPVSAGHPNASNATYRNYPDRYWEQVLCDLVNSVYLVLSSYNIDGTIIKSFTPDIDDRRKDFEDWLNPNNGIWGWLDLSDYEDDCDLGEMLLNEYQAQPLLIAKFYANLKGTERQSVTEAFTKAGIISDLKVSSDLYDAGII